MDGKEVVRQIRDWSAVPIVILTARDQEEEKIAALDAGADDYVTKPFGIGELMARMRVCLRRKIEQDPAQLRYIITESGYWLPVDRAIAFTFYK